MLPDLKSNNITNFETNGRDNFFMEIWISVGHLSISLINWWRACGHLQHRFSIAWIIKPFSAQQNGNSIMEFRVNRCSESELRINSYSERVFETENFPKLYVPNIRRLWNSSFGPEFSVYHGLWSLDWDSDYLRSNGISMNVVYLIIFNG